MADARQRHRAEPQLDQRHSRPLSAERHPERSAQQPHVRHGPGLPVSRRGLFGPRRLAAGPGRGLGPLSVHAPDPRDRRHHPRRERQAGQRSAEPRRDVDADLPQQRRGRVPVRPRHAQHQCEHRRGQRHADRALHRVAGVGDHPRQQRRLSHQPRPARPPVRLQPHVDARQQALAEGRHRHPAAGARRPGRQLLARFLDVQPRVRRRHVRDALRRVPRRLRRELSAGVGAVLPGEPDERIELLRRGPVAALLEPHGERGPALRVRVGAHGGGRPPRLRVQQRQGQLGAARRPPRGRCRPRTASRAG